MLIRYLNKWAATSVRVIIGLLASATFYAPCSARAGFMVTVDNVAIADNGPGDLDPAANIIRFLVNIPNPGFTATGTVTETLAPGSASITLTAATILQSGGNAAVLDSITFQTAAFKAIGPPSAGNIHLDGSYVNTAGAAINAASVSLTGFINNMVREGAVNAPGAVGVRAPMAFAPADVGFNPNVGVTMLTGRLTFSLGTSDGVDLPTSATISSIVPEPSTFTLLGLGLLGLLGLLGYTRRRSIQVYHSD
jgi:hypothetical protein